MAVLSVPVALLLGLGAVASRADDKRLRRWLTACLQGTEVSLAARGPRA